jgi:AraC-like DNA-binding protein
MLLSTRIPAFPLRDSVAMLWHWRDYAKPHAMERLMPNGEMTLVVNLHDDIVRVYDGGSLRLTGATRGAVLVGAHSSPMAIDSEEQKHVFGVQFHAGAAAAFFRPPADEMANLHVPVGDLWRGVDLRASLLECNGNPEAMFDAAERILLRQWRAARREMHPAVLYAVSELRREPKRVADLVDATGLSSRRFIELFKRQVGLTPKVFGRLQRFQKAIVAGHANTRTDWCSVALDCGYYDQSHLHRDFREFAGMSPGMYAAAGGEHPNHVPIGV